jgi:hypothetical protein
MAKILSINSRPDTFTSELPDGVVGDVSLTANITLANIESIEIDNVGDYEENMDAEYRIYFKNGDEIQFDGYSGLWKLMSYEDLTKKAKVKVLKDLREILEYNIENIRES